MKEEFYEERNTLRIMFGPVKKKKIGVWKIIQNIELDRIF